MLCSTLAQERLIVLSGSLFVSVKNRRLWFGTKVLVGVRCVAPLCGTTLRADPHGVALDFCIYLTGILIV